MSQENVELALAWQPGPDTDVAELLRDDELWTASVTEFPAVLAEDFMCSVHGIPGIDGQTYDGVEGLRSVWLEWLAPWHSYRGEVEEAIDLGEQVLLLARDFARRQQGAPEVVLAGANVSTFRDGKLARIDLYIDRTRALGAVGLA